MSAVPPPLPRRKSTQPSIQEQDDADAPDVPSGGIAARIAALKLNQIGLNPNDGVKPPPGKNGVTPIANARVNGRPPVPRSVSAQQPSKDSNGIGAANGKQPPPPPPRKIKRNSEINIGATAISQDELARALRRPPPPIPPRKSPTPVSDDVEGAEDIQERGDPSEDGEDDEQSVEEPQPPPLPARRVLPPPLPQRRESSQSSVSSASNRAPALPSRPTPKAVPEPAYESEPEQEPVEEEEVEEEQNDDVCLICRDFSEVDAHAALFPREEVRSLKQLAYDLTAPFESSTDKARAIFTWLHHNIAYDAYSFLNKCVKPSTPDSTLRSGMAVCEGYGGLFADLALHAGLQALKLSGHGKGFGYAATSGGRAPPFEANHAWNAVVFDDNEWHLIDSCWGAGYLDSGGTYNKKFSPQCFTMSNIEFGRRHFPSDKGYQLREDGTILTWEEYILAPEALTEFGTLRDQGYDYETLEPHTKTIQGGQKHTFHIEKRCWHLERRDWWDEYVLMVSPSANERVVVERDPSGPGNGWTATVYVPSDTQQVNLFLVDTVDNKDAKGMRPEDVRRAIGKKGMSFKGVASWPVV